MHRRMRRCFCEHKVSKNFLINSCFPMRLAAEAPGHFSHPGEKYFGKVKIILNFVPAKLLLAPLPDKRRMLRRP